MGWLTHDGRCGPSPRCGARPSLRRGRRGPPSLAVRPGFLQAQEGAGPGGARRRPAWVTCSDSSTPRSVRSASAARTGTQRSARLLPRYDTMVAAPADRRPHRAVRLQREVPPAHRRRRDVLPSQHHSVLQYDPRRIRPRFDRRTVCAARGEPRGTDALAPAILAARSARPALGEILGRHAATPGARRRHCDGHQYAAPGQ